jgi:hypothetical protein
MDTSKWNKIEPREIPHNSPIWEKVDTSTLPSDGYNECARVLNSYVRAECLECKHYSMKKPCFGYIACVPCFEKKE